MGSLLGGSKSKSQSTQSSQSSNWNQSYDFLKDTLGGSVGSGTQAANAIAALLGLGGNTQGANTAFQNYLGSTGYNFMRDQGLDAIQGSAAGRGVLGSGATMRALSDYGQNTSQQYFNNYLQQLLGLTGTGLQAGQLISGAGGRAEASSEGQSTSSSRSSPGIGGLIGGGLSALASGG